jgi:hypothetical protein
MAYRQIPVHPVPCMPSGVTGFGLSAVFEELAIQPFIDVVIADRWQDRPFRQRLVSLILEQDFAVFGLLTGESTLVYEMMMVPA